jgi:hypothetical protein
MRHGEGCEPVPKLRKLRKLPKLSNQGAWDRALKHGENITFLMVVESGRSILTLVQHDDWHLSTSIEGKLLYDLVPHETQKLPCSHYAEPSSCGGVTFRMSCQTYPLNGGYDFVEDGVEYEHLGSMFHVITASCTADGVIHVDKRTWEKYCEPGGR